MLVLRPQLRGRVSVIRRLRGLSAHVGYPLRDASGNGVLFLSEGGIYNFRDETVLHNYSIDADFAR